MFQMRQISLVNQFYTYKFPDPPSASGLTYKDFTYLKLDEGGIIVGQATSFKDFNSKSVAAAAPSGFFYGFEAINSCFILNEPGRPRLKHQVHTPLFQLHSQNSVEIMVTSQVQMNP